MDGQLWEQISAEAKDLISKILVVDPEKRFLVDQCLAHPWFKETTVECCDKSVRRLTSLN